MRLIIEARIVDGDSNSSHAGSAVLAEIERPDRSLSELGLALSEGRSLLAEAQQVLVSHQANGWLADQIHCSSCGSTLKHKESRSRVVRTVYGKQLIAGFR